MPGVHALTDVTGFGLLGHLLEIARGSSLAAEIDYSSVPLLPRALELAREGLLTGASGRNWKAYGHSVVLDPELPEIARGVLTDPQTSGGLLVSCAPEAVADVLAVFAEEGFGYAQEIGRMVSGAPGISVI
jgi:selenide,water dikinase